MKRPLLISLLSTASFAAIGTAALADPPARVGRIAYTEGDVSFQPPDTDEWTSATRNFPVAPGEAFWTGDDGRAELQIGSVDARLDSETELDVVDVDYGDMRLGLPQGSLDIRLWRSPRRPVIIATPAGDVRLDARGLYRIDVGAPRDGYYPPVEVTVFDGAAEAPSPEGLTPVQPGQAALIYAGYDPEIQYAEGAAIDDWGRDLEARMRWRPSDETADLTGLGDLYAAGSFVDDPDYGQVWFPRDVPYDWAPYRDGHWAYVEPWGYTWIDDQPWGFAPFHYGRWAEIRGRWGWVPGRPTPEPVYAPALVAFFGGVGWRLGDSDAIGWAPLAPDEDYRPSYSVSVQYRTRLNEGAFRGGYRDQGEARERPPESYRNVRAATVVRAGDFSGARPVRAAALPVAANVIASAPVAAPQARPAPTPWARTGLALRQGAGPQSAPPPVAARPPAALAAVRRAVVAPPPAPGRPPTIVGARIAPPAPPPAGAGRPAPVAIAPAQLHRPQGPAGQPTNAPRPAYAGPSPAGAGAPGAAEAAQRAAAAQAAARAQAAQAQAAQAQAERARAEQAGQAQTQAERARAEQAGQAQTQAEQARAREAQAQAQAAQARAAQAQAAQAQAERARAEQARQAQTQAEQARAREAQAAQAQAAQARAAQAGRPGPG